MLNKLKISVITIVILSINSQKVFSQLFNADQNPLSVKWWSINADGIRIIYPAELSAEALRMANTVNKIYPEVGAGLGRKKTMVPLLLQNRGIVANGFVQLAPKKSEFYTTPPQYFDSQDWLNNLAVHELRHVAQFDKMTGGRLSPFPQEAYFAYMGAAIPTWFFEGDAVLTETALTTAGRGRQPNWIMPYRAQLLSGVPTSYSKAYLGSSNDPYIGYYQLGYLLTSAIRKRHGATVFDSLLTDITKRPLRLYPFSSSLKKLTGKNTRQWFLETQAEIAETWREQERLTSAVNYDPVDPRKDLEIHRYLPAVHDENWIVSLEQSLQRPAQFVLTSGTRIKRLLKIGQQEQPWFSYADGKIVWNETRYDKRYGKRSYNVICLYDIRTGKRMQLTNRTRYFSPALSGDGKKIAVVSVDLANRFQLLELDAATGSQLNAYSMAEGTILQTPAYNVTGDQIAFITLTEAGKSLEVLNLADGKRTVLLANSRQQLSRPVFIRSEIAFNAHFNGTDNIYSINPDTRKISALTNARFGAFNAALTDDGKLLFNVYEKNGHAIAITPLIPATPGKDQFAFFGEASVEQEGRKNIFDTIPQQNYTASRYRALSGLFNVHSISPDIDADGQPGLLLKSANLLNTVNMYAGAHWVSGVNKPNYSAGIDFKALYPIFSMRYDNRPRRAFFRSQTSLKQFDWREDVVRMNVSVPFQVNAYQHIYRAELTGGTSYTQRHEVPGIPLIRAIRFPFEVGLNLNHSVRVAPRDLAPKWAQYISLRYNRLPDQQTGNGTLYAFASSLYFPGILPNHSFNLGYNIQKSVGDYRYSIDIPLVYGYNQVPDDAMLHNTLLLNYRFPIAFPDLQLGPLAYVRNLRGGLFTHFENLGKGSSLKEPKTFGAELRSSVNFFRYLPVADIGTRLIFVNKRFDQSPLVELIFNINL